MTTEISNMDDVIDSRDVIARIAELETEREAFLESEPPSESPEKAEARITRSSWPRTAA